MLFRSLLPRHRGLLPYFWTYWHGDEAGGVTAHRMVGRADAGAILAQRAFPIPRGWPVDELNRAVGVIAGPVVADALAAVERGDPGRDQDEARATLAPFVRPGRATIPFAEWDTARVWHMLHGLDRYFHEPLRDANDRRIRYTSVGAWRAGTPDLVPGVVRCDGRAGTLACRDGVIDLLGVSLAP